MPAKKQDNMSLWKSVEKTDPKATKRVNQRGGFTAIDAYAQIAAATQLWGPYGSTWGLEDSEFQLIRANDDTAPICIAFYATFKYPDGAFQISTDMVFKANDECHKKLRTDALTKALSMLGFNADVFLGKFDDNKYVAARTKEAAAEAKAPEAKPEPAKEPEKGNGKAEDAPSEAKEGKDWPGPTPEEVAAKNASSDDDGPTWEEWYEKVQTDLAAITTEKDRVAFVGVTKPAYEMCATENMDIAEAVAKAFADKKAELAAN